MSVATASAEQMRLAVMEIAEGRLAVRVAAKMFDIPYSNSTLHAYASKVKSNGGLNRIETNKFAPNYTVRQVFSIVEEEMLSDYLVTAARHNYGLIRKAAQSLAYDYAVANKKAYNK